MTINDVKLISLIDDLLKQSGTLRKGGLEIMYYCPFCGHCKKKLELSLDSNSDRFGRWHCWVCDSKGQSFRSLFRKLNIQKVYYNRLYDITGGKKPTYTQVAHATEVIKTLPDTFIPLSKETKKKSFISPHRVNAMKYLLKRGITEIDILRYNIGYSDEGEYSGRVIIPSYDFRGNLNFFSSRSFYDSVKMKYKNPSWSKDIIGFELLINWNEPISLTEGVFDALAIKRNVIPLFGKTMSFSLKEAIIRNGVDRVNIILDADAQNDAMNIQNFLISHEVDAHFIKLTDEDPSLMGFNRINNLIETSNASDFKSMLEMKLK